MRAEGLHHVAVYVPDVASALDFYTEVLGLGVRPDRPALGVGGVWLDAGAQQVHLVEGEPPPDHGQHFALRVVDLATVVTELRAVGVEISDPVPIGSGLQSFLADPAGNLIELHEAARQGG